MLNLVPRTFSLDLKGKGPGNEAEKNWEHNKKIAWRLRGRLFFPLSSPPFLPREEPTRRLSFFPPLAFNGFKFSRYFKRAYSLHCLGRILQAIASSFSKLMPTTRTTKAVLGPKKIPATLKTGIQRTHGRRAHSKVTHVPRNFVPLGPGSGKELSWNWKIWFEERKYRNIAWSSGHVF